MLKKLMKFLMKASLKIFIVLSFLTIAAYAPNMHQYYLRLITMNKVVKVQVGRGSGTGFHVELPSGKIAILTNYHVCRNGVKDKKGKAKYKIKVFRYSNKERAKTVKVLKYSNRSDLCLLEPIEGASGLELASNTPFIGKIVYVTGHPLGGLFSIIRGEYLGQKLTLVPIFLTPTFLFPFPKMVSKYNMLIYPGNSGSPIMDFFGNVVGVATWGSPRAPDRSNSMLLIEINDFLADQ